MKVCIIGASGKLGQYMIEHCLARGYELTGVCRETSVGKLERFKGQIEIFPGATNDAALIAKAMQGCALFMVDALTNDALIHEAPAIVSCKSQSAQAALAPTSQS